MRTRPLLFVLLHAAVCRGQSLLCNTVSALGADFARQFAKQQYPLVDGRALDSAFRDTCLAQTKANPTFYCEPLAPYPALRATCLSYSSCTTSCGRSITQATRTYCLDGCNTAIQSFCNTLTDRRALYNLPIAAPSASFADYNVQIDGMAAPGALDYSSRLSATTTTWFAVKFSNASVRCNTTDTALCKNPLLALQPAFFSSSFAIAYDTFVMDNAKQYPDLQYHPTFRAKVGARMLRLGTARSNDAAFWTRGCTPPEFTVRVAFAATKMPATGYSVQPGTQVACYNRTIYIMDMREETPAYNCRFPHYVNTLRNMLDSPAKGETYEIRRQAAVKSMQAEYFAYSADGTRAVLYSLSQINNIFDCVGPAAGIGGVWTIGSPGTCTACTTRTTSSHMQTRYCNRSLVADQNRDCCYRCMPGYMMVLSPLSGNQQVCVSECKRNTQYSNGRCEPCPRGQFSAGGNDRCLTCDAMGFVNARVDSVRGCVPCDPRFLASVDLCVPCPASQIVIAGACTPCVSLGAYFLSPTLLQCQPCGPGTFMQLPTTTTCQTCPLNTYLNATAATACKYCASGYQSVPNRTVCAPCPAINRTLLPYSQYFQRGCNMRCMSGSYGTNPYAAGGCRSCASVTLPVGTYALSASCADPRPCTNAPAAGAVYTAAAPLNTATCPYACQIGYREPTCTPCAYAGTGYNPLLHAPIAGAGCPFDCVPGLFRDGTRACTKACVQLVDELANGNIRARVRDYPAGVRRPHYVLGVCGSTSTFPTAEIPFLRKAWWAYLSDYATSTCGNALLETGEACDDGNAVAGDGCSSACQVETGSYWDCDVVGAPCLPNCGWKTQTSDQWGISLRGFLLPPCSPTSGCSCQQLSYYNVSLMPVGSRRPWMVQHLVPCNCDGNIMRTLPYEQCTVANRGCRLCAAGQYHDDVRGRCVACGSDCLPGYRQNPQPCAYGFATSSNLLAPTPIPQQQANIGCMPCPAPAAQVRYLGGNDGLCRFACYKDTTGENRTQDTFCSVTPSADSSCASGLCHSCADGLQILRVAYQSALAAGLTTYNGYFIDQCRDIVGHAWRPCDPASKPAYAAFVSGSDSVGASTGCLWACPADTTYSYHRTCLPCTLLSSITATTCRSGDYLQPCNKNGQYKTCVPCEGVTPYPLQIWTTSELSLFQVCQPDCEPGVSWSVAAWTTLNQTQCQPCAVLVCALGELFSPCTPRRDTSCQSCAQIAAFGPLPAHQEYITAGLCSTRCVAGYYYDSIRQLCVVCAPVAGACPPGQRQTSFCESPAERRAAPLCTLCTNTLAANQVWAAAASTALDPCAVTCAYTFALAPNSTSSCVKCASTLCALGQAGTCTDYWPSTYIDCAPCPNALQPLTEEYVAPGSCTKKCRSGFALNPYRQCTAVVVKTTPAPVASDSAEAAALIYPSRQRQHSGM